MVGAKTFLENGRGKKRLMQMFSVLILQIGYLRVHNVWGAK